MTDEPFAPPPDWSRIEELDAAARGEDLELAGTLTAVENMLRRYVVFHDEAQPVAVTLWTAHTWIVDQFETTAYLAVTSPEKRSGKTRLLDVLELLVARPWRAVMPSEAVVYRKVQQDRPTLLLDEVDAIYGPKARDHEGLRALLNAGHRAGTTVPRCVGEGTNMRVEDFPVFCAKALSGIGDLPDTVADRSIPIRMMRRARHEPVERFRIRNAEQSTVTVRERLEAWATSADLADARPDVPVELDDRAADGWEPLLAVADRAGGRWPQRARTAALTLHADEDAVEASLGVQLLADIRAVLNGTDKMFTADLLQRLYEIETSPWGDWQLSPHRLSRMVGDYGPSPKKVRIGDDTRQGYTTEMFADAWARYLPPPFTEGGKAEHRNTGSGDQNGTRNTPPPENLPLDPPNAQCSEVPEKPPSEKEGEGTVPDRTDDVPGCPMCSGGTGDFCATCSSYRARMGAS